MCVGVFDTPLFFYFIMLLSKRLMDCYRVFALVANVHLIFCIGTCSKKTDKGRYYLRNNPIKIGNNISDYGKWY